MLKSAYKLLATIAAPVHDVLGTAHSESETCGLALSGEGAPQSRLQVEILGSQIDIVEIVGFECGDALQTLPVTNTYLI